MGNGKIRHTYEAGIGVTISTIKNDAREGNYGYEHFLFVKRILNSWKQILEELSKRQLLCLLVYKKTDP